MDPGMSGGKRTKASQVDELSHQGRGPELFTTHRSTAIQRLLLGKNSLSLTTPPPLDGRSLSTAA
jgi:hypothetical protein